MSNIEERIRKHLLEFYCTIQGTDTPAAYDLTLSGSIRVLEWFNRLSNKMGRIENDEGDLLVCHALSWFQYVLLTVNIYPRQKDDCFLLEDADKLISGTQLNLKNDFVKYSIKDSPLLKIPFAGLVLYQANCLPYSKLHRRWDILNLIKKWKQICRTSRKFNLDEQGFYTGTNELKIELPSAYCCSQQLRHIFIDLGLKGFFLDKEKMKNAVLFTKNFNKEDIPASLCFTKQKGYEPIDKRGLGLRFLSRTVSLNHTYPDSGFLWFEFA